MRWFTSHEWVYTISALLMLILLLILYFLPSKLTKRTAAPTIPFPAWNPQDAATSLKEVYAATVAQGQSAIDWYRTNIRGMRLGSRIVRLCSISLASFGALVPLLANAFRRQDQTYLFDPQWGYFAFALAVVVLGIDKFYGFSTGWARYIKTQLALERGLSDLHYDWAALLPNLDNQPLTPERLQPMLQKLKDYSDFVHTQIQQETEAWLLEFQTNLSDLMTTVKAQQDTTKPGSVQVTIANAAQFDGGVTVNLDQGTELPVQGGQCFFPSVSPGPHAVFVKGIKGGKNFPASDVVKVSAGTVSPISITVPGT
jgi:hypothetical protein